MSVPAGPEVPMQSADIAGLGAGIALGHVRRRLDMARQDVAHRAARLQRRVERVDRRARHAEGAGNAFLFENENGGIDCAHPGHELAPLCLLMVGACQRAGYFSIFSEYFFIL